jgi:hypothetical protein
MGTVSITNPPVFVRERPKTGGFKHTERGDAFSRIKSAKTHTSLEESRGTFRARKVPRAAFFSYFSLQKQRKVPPKTNQLSRNNIPTTPKQKQKNNFSPLPP